MDKDSGKPKGYGFCEYPDRETANSAVRNLNNFDLNGRLLRVDFADKEDHNNDRPPRSEIRRDDVCLLWLCGCLMDSTV